MFSWSIWGGSSVPFSLRRYCAYEFQPSWSCCILMSIFKLGSFTKFCLDSPPHAMLETFKAVECSIHRACCPCFICQRSLSFILWYQVNYCFMYWLVVSRGRVDPVPVNSFWLELKVHWLKVQCMFECDLETYMNLAQGMLVCFIF